MPPDSTRALTWSTPPNGRQVVVLKLFRQSLASQIRRAEWVPSPAPVPRPAAAGAAGGAPGPPSPPLSPIMPSREPDSVDQVPFKSMFTSGRGRAVYLSHDPMARVLEERRKVREDNFDLDGSST